MYNISEHGVADLALPPALEASLLAALDGEYDMYVRCLVNKLYYLTSQDDMCDAIASLVDLVAEFESRVS